MLNWADLCTLLTLLVSAFTGATAAHTQKAGWVAITIFAIVGFFLGAAFAFGASKLAYSALTRSIAPRGQRETPSTLGYTFLYMSIPILSLFAASATTALVTAGVISLFQ